MCKINLALFVKIFLIYKRKHCQHHLTGIRKDRKAGLLVSLKEVTVLSSVEKLSSDTSPVTQSTAQISAQPSPVLHPSAQVSVQAPATSSSSTQDVFYVTSEHFSAMSEKMAEQFECFEALLSRGNIFSAPKMSVTPVSPHQILSDKPGIDPTARPIGPVRLPAKLLDEKGSDSKPDKKKSHKSKSKHKSDKKSHRHSYKYSDRHFDKSDTRVPAGAFPLSTGTTPAGTQDIPEPGIMSVPPQPGLSQAGSFTTGQLSQDASATGQAQQNPIQAPLPSAYGPTGQEIYPPASAAFVVLPDDSEHYSYSELDEGELSDNFENQEVTEDMNYRETVQSVRSFMGWNHIPVFEADFSEPDRSNNPWKGKVPKRPARVSPCHQMTGCARNLKG